MKVTGLILDFDGVLGLSAELAWEAATRLCSALGLQVSISNTRELREALAAAAGEMHAGAAGGATLREMHRLAMRSRGSAIPRHGALLDLLASVRAPRAIITAGYAETAHRCLGEHAASFRFIRGREIARKPALLAGARSGDFHGALYIGDTVRDIHACREVGLPVCAAGWAGAYDPPEKLAQAQPTWLVRSVGELAALLETLNLLS